MVIAVAGRRIDAKGAEAPRFPEASVSRVTAEIRETLLRNKAQAIVSAAACGTDLIALEAAKALGLRRRVVLPFARERFRETSVVDRPGDWGGRYDAVLDEVERSHDLIVLGEPENDPATYPRTNSAILEEALSLARGLHTTARALVVWDGKPRSEDDVTAHFREEARRRQLSVDEILTV